MGVEDYPFGSEACSCGGFIGHCTCQQEVAVTCEKCKCDFKTQQRYADNKPLLCNACTPKIENPNTPMPNLKELVNIHVYKKNDDARLFLACTIFAVAFVVFMVVIKLLVG